MKTNNNDKNFTLSIRRIGDGRFKPRIIDYSSLKDYKSIYQEIIKINKELKEKEIEIHLKNRNNELELKEYIIYDDNDWNIIFNYNIINECFLEGNNIKLDCKEINKEKKELNKENKKKILDYIMKKIPENFYLNILYKFLLLNKDIGELFKIFFLEELKKLNINEIKKGVSDENENENMKEKIIELIKSIKIIEKDVEDKNKKYLNSLKTLNSIKDIINDNKEEDNINYSDISGNNKILKIKNNFEQMEEEDNIFLSYSKQNINYNKIFDENKYLKKFSSEEYYDGIENFKKELSKEIIDIRKIE